MDIPSTIDRLGGTSDVARLIGVTSRAVSNWKARGSIPVEYWTVLVGAAAARRVRGITFASLARMHAKEREVAP